MHQQYQQDAVTLNVCLSVILLLIIYRLHSAVSGEDSWDLLHDMFEYHQSAIELLCRVRVRVRVCQSLCVAHNKQDMHASTTHVEL